MSILPLTIMPSLAVSILSITIPVQDVVYTKVSGVDTQGTPVNRNLSGTVEVNGKKLEQIFGGPVADGDIGIVTTDTLYFLDLWTPGTTRKQSFLTHAGTQYRVTKVADWSSQLGTKVYLAERHVTQDTI